MTLLKNVESYIFSSLYSEGCKRCWRGVSA